MSREIKFRARFKRISNGAECWQILHISKGFVGPSEIEGFIQVSDWEQFTGLKDKNGVEIYEGDIVKWTHLKHWWTAVIEPIESCPNGPLYAVERTNNMSVNDDEEYTYQLTHSRLGVRNELPFLSKSAEVIGNRFETPELLEDK